VGSKLKRK